MSYYLYIFNNISLSKKLLFLKRIYTLKDTDYYDCLFVKYICLQMKCSIYKNHLIFRWLFNTKVEEIF